MFIPREAMPSTPPLALRFRAVSYNYPGSDWRKTICLIAKPGKIYAVVRRYPGRYRMRLYANHHGDLVRFDQLVDAGIFYELVAKQSYDQDKIDYYGFEHTNGSDSSGFGWPENAYSNVALGIIYALAEIVHGDRKVWTAQYL
jgi:hypothetical protein